MKAKRNTKQKELILDYVKLSCTHPTAEEVYKGLVKDNPNLSLATVYRNLQDMVDDKLIDKLIDERGTSRYDGKDCRHYHFICINCQKIFDLDLDYDESIDEKISDDFKVDNHSVVYRGLCINCQNDYSKEKEK